MEKLVISDVVKTYKDTVALKDVNLELEKGIFYLEKTDQENLL